MAWKLFPTRFPFLENVFGVGPAARACRVGAGPGGNARIDSCQREWFDDVQRAGWSREGVWIGMKMPFRFLWLAGLLAATLAFAEDLLPGPVLFHLKEAERIIERAEKTFRTVPTAEPRRTKALQAAKVDLEAARAKMGELEQRFSGEYSPFHPDIQAVQKRMETLDQDFSSAVAPAISPPAEDEVAPSPAPGLPPLSGSAPYWLARLRPFVARPGQPGHDPSRYLEPYASPDADQMQQRLDIYSQALATLTEYRQARLGAAAPLELQQVAADIESALRRFGLSCIEHANEDLVEAQQALQQFEQFIQAQDERMAAAEPIQLLDRDQLRQVEATVVRAARLVRAEDPCLVDVRQRLVMIKRHDARLRAARAAETVMRADVYVGADALALKQVAGRAAMEHQPGLRVLRVSIVSPEWRTESYAEWADFDQTVLQPRVARMLTAHVAAQFNAETRRYTVTLRQGQLPSGLWGPVSGTVTFVDPMLLENVTR
jgi:hypothetical protein